MENQVKKMSTSENAEAWKEMLRNQNSSDIADNETED
jgi:hypothetical protein